MKKINSISIISDTHGHIDNRISPYLKESDMIIHAGDVCDTKIISDLKKYCQYVYVVAGNNDIPDRYNKEEDRKIISKLKKIEKIKLNNHTITVEHGNRFGGNPSHEELRNAHPDSKLVIYGHSHNQVCDQNSEPWVINPGACGHTRNNDGGPCFMQIKIDNQDNWKIVPYCFD